jgi:membrane protein DedA with SNARE-associated domain
MEKLFIYLTDLSSGLSYFIIFGILVACGLGFPLPEDIPLVASGYLVWDGTMAWGAAVVVTLTGVGIGDSILFFIGRKLGMRILEPAPNRRVLFPPHRVRRTRAYFRKYGEKIVFFARFVAGFRAVAFFMAGAMRMPFSRFILLDMLAALMSVPLWMGLGYSLGHYFGSEIGEILARLKSFKHGVTLLTATVVIAVLVKLFLKYRQAKITGTRRSRRSASSTPKSL